MYSVNIIMNKINNNYYRFLNNLLNIKHPLNFMWSPDGEKIAFVWNEGGSEGIWVVSRDTKPVRLTNMKEQMGSLNWTNDGKNIIYSQDGHIYNVSVTKGKISRLTRSEHRETHPTISPDGSRLAFLREGDLWSLSLNDCELIQLTSGPLKCFDTWKGSPPRIKIEINWSPDSSKIAFTALSTQRISENASYVGSKINFIRYLFGTPNIGVVSSNGGEITWLAESDNLEGNPMWSPDGKRLAITRIGKDYKFREILLVSSEGDPPDSIFREEDSDGWTSPMSPQTLWSPDGRRILIVSDRDGWDHLYLLPVKGGEFTQLTCGEYEDSYPCWSPDGSKIAFVSNRGSMTERHIWVKSVKSGEEYRLTSLRGTNFDPKWSPDGREITFFHSGPHNSRDLWIKRVHHDSKPAQLTNSMPQGINKSNLLTPNLIWYKSKGGENIPASLLTPTITKGKKYPAIIWVHGGGVRQNRYGWHPDRAYAIFYSFHQYLLQKDYVILMVDYRGSIGYGKRFRFGHYMDLGGGDLRDLIKGAEYLKSLDYIDPERLGIWGFSYGGYLTLQALLTKPDHFKVGIDFAGVVDWLMWAQDPSGAWIGGRMGSPEENLEKYMKSSPINYLENLSTPLLILHGTDDVDVPILQTVRLVSNLINERKDFDLALYPGEAHFFSKKESWLDAFRRVEKFLDYHLND